MDTLALGKQVFCIWGAVKTFFRDTVKISHIKTYPNLVIFFLYDHHWVKEIAVGLFDDVLAQHLIDFLIHQFLIVQRNRICLTYEFIFVRNLDVVRVYMCSSCLLYTSCVCVD